MILSMCFKNVNSASSDTAKPILSYSHWAPDIKMLSNLFKSDPPPFGLLNSINKSDAPPPGYKKTDEEPMGEFL